MTDLSPGRTSLQAFVEHRWFQAVVLALIIVNAIILGAETILSLIHI